MFRQVDAALKLAGMTRGELAAKLGITSSTLSMKLNGKSPIPLTQALMIKKILNSNLSLEELFSITIENDKAG